MAISSGVIVKGRKPHAIYFDEPSLTVQSSKDECDINNILKRYKDTGVITHVKDFQGVFADVSELPADYQSSLNLVSRAKEAFEALPAHVRDRFRNDPGAFYRFAIDPSNLKEMVDLGLAEVVASEPIAGDVAGGSEAGGARGASATAKAPPASKAARKGAPPIIPDDGE